MSVKHLLMAKKSGNFDIGASGWDFSNSTGGSVTGGNPLPATRGLGGFDEIVDARKTLNLRAGTLSFTSLYDWLEGGGADVALYIGGVLRLSGPMTVSYWQEETFTYNLIPADLGSKQVRIVIHAGDSEAAMARLVAVSIPIV